jgi:hypothetical protein
MFAVIAAVLFGLALLFELLKTHFDVVTPLVLTTAGLVFLALHFTGTGAWRRSRR